MNQDKLREIQDHNSKVFVKFFKTVFGKAFDVECDWGFPETNLRIESNTNIQAEDSKKRSRWNLKIHVIDGTYSLKTYGDKWNGSTWIPDFATIDSRTIDYIVNSTIELSTKIFGLGAEEKMESKPEPEPEQFEMSEETEETNEIEIEEETEETKKVE